LDTSTRLVTLYGPALPGHRENAIFGYDPASQRVVLAGGQHFIPPSTTTRPTDTWTFDGQLRRLEPGPLPGERLAPGVLSRPDGLLALGGGWGAGADAGNYDDVIQWRNGRWWQQPERDVVSRTRAALFTAADGALLAFGGRTDAGLV